MSDIVNKHVILKKQYKEFILALKIFQSIPTFLSKNKKMMKVQ